MKTTVLIEALTKIQKTYPNIEISCVELYDKNIDQSNWLYIEAQQHTFFFDGENNLLYEAVK